ASARVSQGEFDAVKAVTDWARQYDCIDRIEVLSFVDNGTSISWLQEAGVAVQNLLTKGSLNHLTYQLRKKPAQHFSEIAAVIELAKARGIATNVYLEDWSNGMRHSRNYVWEYLDFLSQQPVRRIMLPDTLGILTPAETFNYIREIKTRYPDAHLDFHAHNDYDLGTANVLAAVNAGADGLHLTVNGMG